MKCPPIHDMILVAGERCVIDDEASRVIRFVITNAQEREYAVMTSTMAQVVTDVCNELPFVNWDRFVDCGRTIVVFGWIDREKDDYKDFVSVEVSQRGFVEFTTSSAKYSEIISDIYVKQGRLPPGTHESCQRIEDSRQLSGVRNVVKIRKAQ